MGIFAFLPVSEAHILVIGDSNNYDEASKIGADLKSKGYNVLGLYKENATAKNILKGMYDADAVIYAGHGGYKYNNYDGNGGTATSPFALVGTDNKFIWGEGDQMREDGTGKLFTAPFKQDVPVFLLHTCFSTGWVEDKEVANPIETIYNFANMFTGAGANYYATAWNGAEIIYDFLNGAVDFATANNQNYEKITKSTVYNGIEIWRNDHTDSQHSFAAFVGDWAGKFPTAAETTAYDDAAAESWYNSDRVKKNLTCKFTVSSPCYINQPVTFTEGSTDLNGYITGYTWNFGDGNEISGTIPTNPSHTYTTPGIYTVTHTVTDNNTETASSSKIVTVVDRSPVANFYLTTSNLRPKVSIGFRSSSYDLDAGDNIISYNWNFGDGSTGSGTDVQHVYARDGIYTVILTVTDTFGKTSSKSVKITVINPKPDLVVTKAYKYRGYLYVTVKNQGKVTSGACYTRAAYGRYYKNIYTYGLKPGVSRTYRVYFKYRHGAVKTDYYNRISELSEGNNLRYF